MTSVRATDASRSAVREFLEGPSLRDAMISAVELAGHSDWFAAARAPDAARGHGIEPTGWSRTRFGLANL
jgi:hypothetical protein